MEQLRWKRDEIDRKLAVDDRDWGVVSFSLEVGGSFYVDLGDGRKRDRKALENDRRFSSAAQAYF